MKKVQITNLAVYGVFTIAAILTLLPTAWAFITSFKKPWDIMTEEPVFIFEPTIDNYLRAFFHPSYLFYEKIMNSVIVATSTTIICVALACLAGYALTRFDFRGSSGIASWILSIRMLPIIAVLIPWFLIFNSLKLIDTYLALIIPYMAFTLPFAVWMIRGFFLAIPRELDEAALTEGYSRLEILWKIILPLAKPGIIITAIFSEIFCWNEFQFALVLTRTHMTVPVGLAHFLQGYRIEWGPLFAATMVTAIPFIVVTIFLQKHVVRGLTLGAVTRY